MIRLSVLSVTIFTDWYTFRDVVFIRTPTNFQLFEPLVLNLLLTGIPYLSSLIRSNTAPCIASPASSLQRAYSAHRKSRECLYGSHTAICRLPGWDTGLGQWSRDVTSHRYEYKEPEPGRAIKGSHRKRGYQLGSIRSKYNIDRLRVV